MYIKGYVKVKLLETLGLTTCIRIDVLQLRKSFYEDTLQHEEGEICVEFDTITVRTRLRHRLITVHGPAKLI